MTFASQKRLSVTSPSQVKRWHTWLYKGGIHIDSRWNLYRARYFFEVMPCEETFTFRPPILNLPPSAWLPSHLPKKYIQVHTTSAWPHKSWPAEHWAKTLTALDKKGIGPFVLTGGSTEWEQQFVREIELRTGAPVLNLCGKTPLKAYLACVANAEMVLCIDGSATHLASAFNRRSLTLFGPSDPTSWHYPSDYSAIIHGREYSPERGSARVSNIPVDAVICAAESLLNKHYNIASVAPENWTARRVSSA
jgi:ADP-heptose:LPS heptosyltransferase